MARAPRAVNANDDLFPADLTDRDAVHRAVAGAEVASLTVGLPYDLRVWQSQWPLIMRNVLDACRTLHCRLVFFDNIYSYDAAYLDGMREDTPMQPPSRKGQVRPAVVEMLQQDVDRGRVQALIARAADFYGPGIGSSILQETVAKNLRRGKKAQLLVRADTRHNYT